MYQMPFFSSINIYEPNDNYRLYLLTLYNIDGHNVGSPTYKLVITTLNYSYSYHKPYLS